MTTPPTRSFVGDIKIAGINPYVDVPAEVVAALPKGARPAVLVRVARPSAANASLLPPAQPADAGRLQAIGRLTSDGWFRTTLIRLKEEPVRLFLDRWMRAAAGVEVGARVVVALKPDNDPRILSLPAILQEALVDDPTAWAGWEQLAPSRQREILTYLNYLKSEAALQRNVRKLLADLKK